MVIIKGLFCIPPTFAYNEKKIMEMRETRQKRLILSCKGRWAKKGLDQTIPQRILYLGNDFIESLTLFFPLHLRIRLSNLRRWFTDRSTNIWRSQDCGTHCSSYIRQVFTNSLWIRGKYIIENFDNLRDHDMDLTNIVRAKEKKVIKSQEIFFLAIFH